MLLAVLIIWRLYLFLIAFVSSRLFTFDPKFPYSEMLLTPSKLPEWLWAWGNFDGVHYLMIAQHSYAAQFTQAFFPLYPLLLRIFSIFTRDNFMIISGIIFSFVFTSVAIKLLFKLLRLDYSVSDSFSVILALLFFPTSFFLGALYTEALFLSLAVLSFLLARQKKWLAASLVCALASATRITGLFLLPALLWEWYINDPKVPQRLVFRWRKFRILLTQFIRSVLRSPVLYIGPLGLIIYMLYLHITFGDALYFLHAQAVFGAARSTTLLISPPQVVWRYIKILTTVSPVNYHYWTAVWEFISLLGGTGLLIQAHRKKVRLSYLIFSWLTLFIPVLTGTLSSLPRYILLCFPIYISLGIQKSRITKWVWFALSLLLLSFFTLNFIRGWWIA